MADFKYEMPELNFGGITASTPIQLGGMAVRIGQVSLPVAVADQGGIGLIGGSGMSVAEATETVQRARSLTDGWIGFNLMQRMYKFEEVAKAALDAGTDLLVIGAGFSRDVFRWAESYNVPVETIVGSPRVAQMSEKFGAAAVVVEGEDAAGHLGTDETIWDLLPQIVDSVDIPVIAAGGIITGADIYRAFSLGAVGVQMGTRPVLTIDAQGDGLSPTWQQVMLSAGPDDIITLMSPAGMLFRAVNTNLPQQVNEHGVYHMPGPKPRCSKHCLKECRYRDSGFTEKYCIIEALQCGRDGDLVNGLFTIGKRAAEITDLPTIPDLFHSLRVEYNEAKIAAETSV